MLETDVQHLLDLGQSQTAVHDAVEVISYFNYNKRIADAPNVDLERHIIDYEQQLLLIRISKLQPVKIARSREGGYMLLFASNGNNINLLNVKVEFKL